MPGTDREIVCPTWCDNHFRGEPHPADRLAGVLHKQLVALGSDWSVEVYNAEDGESAGTPVVYATGGPDFEDVDELLTYVGALTQAAVVAAGAGMKGRAGV